MIHNLVNHHRPHQRISIRPPPTRAKRLHRRRVIRAKRARAQGREIHPPTRPVAPDGHRALRRAERHPRAEPGQVPRRIGRVQIHLIPMGRIQPEERRPAAEVWIELIFVKHDEPAGLQHRAIGNAEAFGIRAPVAQIPARNIHRHPRRVVQLNGVLERQICVREHLVDDDILQRQQIAAPWRGRAREPDNVRAPVGEAPFGDAIFLLAKSPRIDLRQRGREQPDGFAELAQAETDVVGPLLRVVVRDEPHKAVLAHADEGEIGDAMLGWHQQIVSHVKPAQRNGLRARIEQFEEVIVIARRVGQPFIDAQRNWIAQGRADVRAGGCRQVQRPGAGGVGHATDGTVGRLDAEHD